ncbi:MAG TPA: hypothetical protein VF587_10645 [Solirubrobacteraceae bacterium]
MRIHAAVFEQIRHPRVLCLQFGLLAREHALRDEPLEREFEKVRLLVLEFVNRLPVPLHLAFDN